jgi:hypothetical protein
MVDTNRSDDNTSERMEPTREKFRLLLTANPNHFGSFPDLGFEAVDPKAGDTSYEELDCVSYSPVRDRIEATVLVKRPFGYLGGLCTAGSIEHVRFYIDYGAGWEDAGVANINVHDITVARDCGGDSTHPLSYVCGVDHKPRRNWCGRPVLPLVRAILSWNLEPPPGVPDWRPPWGNHRDCRAQITPRRFIFPDIVAQLPQTILDIVPNAVLEEPPGPAPDPGPLTPLSLEALAHQYQSVDVPAHRFALQALTATASSAVAGPLEMSAVALSAKAANIDLASALQALEDTSGNTTYEELECLGLNTGLLGGSLVASFEVKLTTGYSGSSCSAGSTEYVAFWADWADDCTLTYIGTVKINVHDFDDIGKGLCYAAILPVDLGALRRGCETPVLRRVRAVLSWNTPPSTTNPDAIPFWGNSIERHVQITPGAVYDGNARFTIVGGVAAEDIDLATGSTVPGAVLGIATPLPDDCPFAGRVELHGPLDPALAGHQYRIRATDLDDGGSVLLTSTFTAVTSGGTAITVTPDPIEGWVPWPTWINNTTGVLGFLTPGGDHRWDYTLELDTPFNVVDLARVQMDNTAKNVALVIDTTNAGDLELLTGAQCKIPHGPVNGTFVARDRHFRNWTITVIGGPGGPIPPIPLSAGVASNAQTPFSGTAFTLDFSDPLIAPCGYVVRLTIHDRAIVDSSALSQHATVDRGICLE